MHRLVGLLVVVVVEHGMIGSLEMGLKGSGRVGFHRGRWRKKLEESMKLRLVLMDYCDDSSARKEGVKRRWAVV